MIPSAHRFFNTYIYFDNKDSLTHMRTRTCTHKHTHIHTRQRISGQWFWKERGFRGRFEKHIHVVWRTETELETCKEKECWPWDFFAVSFHLSSAPKPLQPLNDLLRNQTYFYDLINCFGLVSFQDLICCKTVYVDAICMGNISDDFLVDCS